MTLQFAELPDEVGIFLRDLEGVLGSHFIGAILYGSRGDHRANDQSDIDLAVIVADVNADQNRREVYRAFSAARVNRIQVSLSVETYLRLKEFLDLGDPFAWVVCHDGQILTERSDLLSGLQSGCLARQGEIETGPVAGYLKGKCSNHYTQAMESFRQFLANIQLSVMAGAQAAVVESQKRPFALNDLVSLSNWEMLKDSLINIGATRREIECVEALVMAHKMALKGESPYPGKEIMDKVRLVGELWQRLFRQESPLP